ncbi:YtrH family sporulation protein [Natranaerofaba carboxydovora]|uniref:YtrH family sporulation protein n=1 Tax=Natranaerofaba carboxydovora TaxID=2742683 RepID=UPI001F135CC9|nr:YtrH family sporulation protein [Natranaerofaba carboxydovora]UMZ74495.1 Sporulation membrane protein YtrH [Natranaerofaba carboxydovora]
MPNTFLSTLFLNFFIAFGVVLGGSIFGGIGSVFGGIAPMRTMIDTAENLKLWGMFAALGGTFTAMKELELGFIEGQLNSVVKQFIFILSSFMGAHLGVVTINWLSGGSGT